MRQNGYITVTDRDGVRGVIRTPSTELEGGAREVLVELDGEAVAVVPASALAEEPGRGLRLDGSFDEFINRDGEAAPRPQEAARHVSSGVAPGGDDVPDGGREVVIPVVEEKLKVGRRVVDTGGVRVTKKVSERTEVVDEPLLSEEVLVERVRVDEVVETPPPVRQEGDTLIVPVVEEELVVVKRLVLKEVLRITRRRHERREPQEVVVRREEVHVERLEPRGRQSRKAAGGG